MPKQQQPGAATAAASRLSSAPTTARAPRRIRVPFLLDVVLVDDLATITALDADPALTRVVQHTGPLLNRLLSRRVARAFAIGGQALPTFTDRTDTGRARRQRDLETRLTRPDYDFADHAVELAVLAEYVRGGGDAGTVGVAVQTIVGRLFDPGYRATPATYEAARAVIGFPRMLPPRSWWWTVSGKLTRAQRLLAETARHDPAAIHATTNTIHNVVETLSRMRTSAVGSGADLDAPSAVRRCLAPPPALLRWCRQAARVGGLATPLLPGTLVVMRLGRAHDALQDTESPFLVGQWNQCPAHRYVTALLARVWTDAVRIR